MRLNTASFLGRVLHVESTTSTSHKRKRSLMVSSCLLVLFTIDNPFIPIIILLKRVSNVAQKYSFCTTKPNYCTTFLKRFNIFILVNTWFTKQIISDLFLSVSNSESQADHYTKRAFTTLRERSLLFTLLPIRFSSDESPALLRWKSRQAVRKVTGLTVAKLCPKKFATTLQQLCNSPEEIVKYLKINRLTF